MMNISETVYKIRTFNGIQISSYAVLNSVIPNDLALINTIFADMKRRAVVVITDLLVHQTCTNLRLSYYIFSNQATIPSTNVA